MPLGNNGAQGKFCWEQGNIDSPPPKLPRVRVVVLSYPTAACSVSHITTDRLFRHLLFRRHGCLYIMCIHTKTVSIQDPAATRGSLNKYLLHYFVGEIEQEQE